LTILVTYMTLTGNTKKVAEAIYGEIEGEKEIKPMEQVDSLDGYEMAFIGFPTHQFSVPAKAREFIANKAAGKKVALFATHASWVDPSVPPSADMVKGIQARGREAAAGATLLGYADFRGELAEDIATKCLSAPDPTVQMFGKLRPLTVGQPDDNELARARAFARAMMEKLQRPTVTVQGS
jgi:flavodoxin